MYWWETPVKFDFGRSRSNFKVTRGQKVKNFDRPYLGNYWADSLQTKTIMYSYSRAFLPCASFWISTPGKKARLGSKVKSTFSTISQKVLIVSTRNKDHCVRLNEAHKNVAHNFFRTMHRFRVIHDFVFFWTVIFAVVTFQGLSLYWGLSTAYLPNDLTWDHQIWSKLVSWGNTTQVRFWEVKVKGQGHQRSKGQKLWSTISRKLLGRFTPNKNHNVELPMPRFGLPV